MPDAQTRPNMVLRAARWLLNGGWVERDKAAAAFERMHRRDAIGDRIHLIFAMVAAFALAGPTTIAEIAAAPLLVFFFVRVLNAGPTWIHWLGQPVMLGGLALAAWQGLALAWSGDVPLGLDHMGSLRWLAIGVLFWPVIEKRRYLIGALALGFVAGNLSQLGHAIGRAYDISWLTWPRYAHRNSGWWDPVVGGSLLCASLGLHLPAALLGRGRVRIVGLGACAATGVALVATGTRGAWIAAITLVGCALVWALWKAWRAGRGHRRRAVVPVLITLALAIIVGGVAWEFAGKSVRNRVNKARTEIVAGLDGDTSSDTGKRIAMARWGGRAFAERPVAGVGTGGYRAWVVARDPDAPVHNHAHNAPLHIAATNGVVGLALAGFVVLAGVRAGFVVFPITPGARGWSVYDAGPAWAIGGLMLAGMFDAVHLNTQTAAVLGLLLGLCPCWRPVPACAMG
ncbi:MAG: hypothetical protein DHS20C14_09210 [Phycisphaeraceae bacterium]|nr:MAG: hypothetical protein DHS20C14_09210 [Phycisphaeraceae bacterium]